MEKEQELKNRIKIILNLSNGKWHYSHRYNIPMAAGTYYCNGVRHEDAKDALIRLEIERKDIIKLKKKLDEVYNGINIAIQKIKENK